MMKPVPMMTFEAQLTLSEEEVRILEHLFGYDLGKLIQERVTKNFDVEAFDAMCKRIRHEAGCCMNRFDAARAAFNKP